MNLRIINNDVDPIYDVISNILRCELILRCCLLIPPVVKGFLTRWFLEDLLKNI